MHPVRVWTDRKRVHRGLVTVASCWYYWWHIQILRHLLLSYVQYHCIDYSNVDEGQLQLRGWGWVIAKNPGYLLRKSLLTNKPIYFTQYHYDDQLIYYIHVLGTRWRICLGKSTSEPKLIASIANLYHRTIYTFPLSASQRKTPNRRSLSGYLSTSGGCLTSW